MKVVIFGASGMVGQGVLRECLSDGSLAAVVAVGRSPCSLKHPKLTEIPHDDMSDLGPIADRLEGIDACFFCLGVSAAGMREDAYRRITYDMTIHVAETLLARNPDIVFCYISGAGTDSTGAGRTMWARVKGATENRLLEMPFSAAYMFRPGYIQPLKGVRSKTRLYQAMYTVLAPFYPLWKTLAPNLVTTTEKVGQAMIRVARDGYPRAVIETRDINHLAS
jgi:uncharacterized protein YbjT (DUF2867 family)